MTDTEKLTALPPDDREGQAVRYADCLELHPEGVADRQAQVWCDLLSVTKLRSVMRHELGYAIRRKPSPEVCQNGTKQRRRWLFFLVSRPTKQQQELFHKQ